MVQPAQEAPMKSALSWTPYPDPLSGELWGTSASYTSSMMRRLFANGPVSCSVCRALQCRATHREPTSSKWWTRQRSEEHTSELQSLMRISYAVFCLKKKKKIIDKTTVKKL